MSLLTASAADARFNSASRFAYGELQPAELAYLGVHCQAAMASIDDDEDRQQNAALFALQLADGSLERVNPKDFDYLAGANISACEPLTDEEFRELVAEFAGHGGVADDSGDAASCECGDCIECVHRECQLEYRLD